MARIGKADTVFFQQIGSRTRDQYLRLLKKYLSWCVTRYLPRARQNSATHADIDVVFADVADVIERRFESHIINARPDRTRYRSLTDTQLQIVRTLIRPGAAENPFPERLQLRNWLMIELLLETGIRRGELLKLYTYEVYEHYIQSERRPWRDAKSINRRCHAVSRYASRYLAESANRHNAQRTSAAWSRLDT